MEVFWSFYLFGVCFLLGCIYTLRWIKLIEDGPDEGIPLSMMVAFFLFAALWPLWLGVTLLVVLAIALFSQSKDPS